MWAIGTILSLDHEGSEYSSAQPLLRMKDLHGGKAIHPKLPIEVHFDWKGEHNFYWASIKIKEQDVSFESHDLIGIDR
jgi:hypothetical protein